MNSNQQPPLEKHTQDQTQKHNEKPNGHGITRILKATKCSILGFKAAFKHEDAFRQEVFLSLILIPLAFFLESEALHRILMIGSVFLVLIVELLNSAVEAVVDRVSIERHALAKRAKDIGSAAVFVALANVVMTWGLILFA